MLNVLKVLQSIPIEALYIYFVTNSYVRTKNS